MWITSRTRAILQLGIVVASATIIGIGFNAVRLAAGDDSTLIAQVKPTKPSKPEPKPKPPLQKPSKDTQKSDVVDEDEGPSKPAPPVEYEKIKLADGTEIEVEKWGDTFEAYDYRPPVDLEDPRVEEIIWYKNVGSGSPNGLQVDSKGRALYWAEGHGNRPQGRIMRSTLDGKQITALVGDLLRPRDLVVDVEHNRMYWLEGRDKHALKTAELNGKGAKALVEGLNSPFGLALDPFRGELYYWEEPGRIVRVKTDGTAEQQVLSGERDPFLRHWPRGMSWNLRDSKLYWMGSGEKGMIRRLGTGESSSEALFATYTSHEQMHFAINATRGKVAFIDRSYGQLIVANMDGSMRDVLVTPPPKTKNVNAKSIGASVAFDEVRGMLYWSGGHYDGTSPHSAIYRMRLPPDLKATRRPSPPLITAVVPDVMNPNGTIAIQGRNLSLTKAVTFVDDATGERVVARHDLIDDGSLSIVVPKLSDNCIHPLIIVETPSGVTITLQSNLRKVAPDQSETHNRFAGKSLPQLWLMQGSEVATVESAVVFANVGAQLTVGPRGQVLMFLKSGSFFPSLSRPNCEIYHEPLPRWGAIQDADSSTKFRPVSAIRASFLKQPMVYRQ